MKSASSTLEAPVVRAIRRDFAAAISEDFDVDTPTAEMYGRSTESRTTEEPDESFAQAVARAKLNSSAKQVESKRSQWKSAIHQFILDEVIVPRRPAHLDRPPGTYFHWELKQSDVINARWAEARLNGLDCGDSQVIEWIRLCDGERPDLAINLFRSGLSPNEAQLQLGYGGRIDPRRPSLYRRYRDGSMNRTEVIAAVVEWRRRNAAG